MHPKTAIWPTVNATTIPFLGERILHRRTIVFIFIVPISVALKNPIFLLLFFVVRTGIRSFTPIYTPCLCRLNFNQQSLINDFQDEALKLYVRDLEIVRKLWSLRFALFLNHLPNLSLSYYLA